MDPSPPIRGRGTSGNPKNRFETLEYIPADEARDPDDPGPRTQVLRDASRTIIARNESPDVGFDYSVNPYRGCEHGCIYCLGGDTPILMANGRMKPLRSLRVGDEIYGTVRRGWYRRLVKTRVRAHWSTRKPAYRIVLADGTVLVASADHRFLTDRGWKFVTGTQQGRGRRPHLTTRNKLMGTGVRTHSFVFQEATESAESLNAIRTNARAGVEAIERIISWPARLSNEWYYGFLAGIFDAEGSYSGGVLRISNTDAQILRRIEAGLERYGFSYVHDAPRRREHSTVHSIRLRGGLREHLRFFHSTGPAIERKWDIEERAVKSDADLQVVAIEPLQEERRLYDITTGTGDFIADGVVSHNCYARPTHEYLGFSAGLDFETKILAKPDAPEMLRAELMRPDWTPSTIALSGVTDPYQPVERRLRLTRGCLEVLAEFRNPVAIVTKNHLVTRDTDLLASLAEHRAAAVNVSITTLDRTLQRVMEPRTAVPGRRLDAVRALADAGIPVRVLVAPVIPGLTEHELPRILEAAAHAGAVAAGYIPLRLPHGVSDLFERWLERHFPDRKKKVLNRIRAIRGGKLNDAGFHSRMRGEGIYAEQIRALFRTGCDRAGLDGERRPSLSTDGFRRPGVGRQLGLFDDGADP